MGIANAIAISSRTETDDNGACRNLARLLERL